MNKPNQLISLENFFKNPQKTAYSLSPDATHLAFLAPYENRKNIFVQKIGSNEVWRVTNVTDRDLSAYAWANNDRLIYVRDFAGDENFHLFSVTKEGKEEKDLTPFDNVRIEFIDELEQDENFMLIAMNKRNTQIFDPYRININTGELFLVAENPGNITQWFSNHEGKILAAIATDGVNGAILYREKEDQQFKISIEYTFKDTIQPLFFDFHNKHIVYALSNLHRDKAAIVKFNLATGKEEAFIYGNEEVDISNLSYSSLRKVPTVISYITWKKQFHFLDATIEKLYTALATLLPSYEISITSHNKAENIFIVRTYSDRSLGAFYIYNSIENTLQLLSKVSPWLEEDKLSEMKPISYTTKDGFTIHAYLTLPKDIEAKNLPVIINPHGGPWHRDVWGFNPEVQFLANRGYAVLQMNFRGSTGYGRKFWEASFGQWGLKMQDDVTEGVQWLINQGIADPKRVAIYGGSYGGYTTLAGITFTPDLYACAVDYVGVSNLFSFMETIPPYWEPFRQMLYEMVGNPADENDNKRLQATSPVFHVHKIKAPLLIAQGAKDPRVNQAESDQIVAALQQRGVEVEYILKENEGHGFHNQENKFEFYAAMERFFAKYL